MPLHSLLTSLIRYFLDTGWLSFLKYSKIFRVFSPINDLFIFVIYLFIFYFYDSKVAKHCFVAADIVNCLESVKLNALLLFFQMKI